MKNILNLVSYRRDNRTNGNEVKHNICKSNGEGEIINFYFTNRNIFG